MFRTLAIASAVALAGCAARPGAGVATLSSTVPAESALILPAPGTLAIVSVVQRQYTNGIEQQVALSTSAATPGQNFLSIQVHGPAEPVARPGGALAYRPVTHAMVRAEMRSVLPGAALAVSDHFVRNHYGPFGYAFGRGAGGDACLYGWQQIRSNSSERSAANSQGMIQVRLRVCRAGASEADLVELMYGYTIVGGFSGATWNPYGTPAPVDGRIGGEVPLRVPFDTRAMAPAEVRPVMARPAPRRVASAATIDEAGSASMTPVAAGAVVVPSPTGTAQPAEATPDVVVPSPRCVADPLSDTICR
ncbi:cellulose biosynthesis protein BcsN [Ciceribacter sp. sgz301302]